MRLEIPIFTRCCGCLPLRRGIIVLAYLSLAFAVLFIWVELQLENGWSENSSAVYRGANFYAVQWLPVLLYCIEIVFILVLLVGAHMEKPMLMRVYYYYGITTTAAALAIYLWTLMRGDVNYYMVSYFRYFYLLVDLCTIFIGITEFPNSGIMMLSNKLLFGFLCVPVLHKRMDYDMGYNMGLLDRASYKGHWSVVCCYTCYIAATRLITIVTFALSPIVNYK